MRQTSLGPVPLEPGDTFELTHRIGVTNDSSRPVVLVGVRWELVYADELEAADAELLEQSAVTSVS